MIMYSYTSAYLNILYLSFLRKQESRKINRFPLKNCGNDELELISIRLGENNAEVCRF